MRALHAVTLACAALTAILCACGGPNIPAPVAPGLPGGIPSPTPTPFNGHLYVEYGASGSPFGDGFAVYSLPVASQSVPAFVIQTGAQSIAAFAVDASGDVYTTDDLQILKIPAPLNASSVPQTLIAPGPATLPSGVGDVQLDPYGNLWVATSNDVREFPAPITAGESATTILTGGIGASNIQFDPAAGTMYVGPMSVPFGTNPALKVYAAPPYTAPPKSLTPPFGVPIGFDGSGNAVAYTNGFVVNNTLQPGGLAMVHLPVSTASLPLAVKPFDLFQPQSAVHPAAMDGSGNVYAIDKQNANSIAVFALPVAANTSAFARIPCVSVGGTCRTAVGLAIGP